MSSALSVVDKTTPRQWNFETILLTLWHGGIVTIFLWKASLFFVLLHRLKTADVVEGEFAIEWKTLGGRPGRLLLSDGLGPALVGTKVVVPRDLWEETTPEIRSGILRHELAHLRNHDLWWAAVSRIFGVIHWFNPVTWLVLRKIDEAAERLADAAAFGHEHDGIRRLAESLWAFHESSQTLVLRRTTFASGSVDRRVRYLRTFLKQPGDSLMKKMVACILLSLLFVGGMVQLKFVPVWSADVPSALGSEDVPSASLAGETPALLLFDFDFLKGYPESSEKAKMEKIKLYRNWIGRAPSDEKEIVQKEILRLAKSLENPAITGSILLDLTREAWRKKEAETFPFWFDSLEAPYWDWANSYVEANRLAEAGDHDAAKAVLMKLMPDNLIPSDKDTQEEVQQ